MQGASAVREGKLAGGRSTSASALGNLHLVLIGIALVVALAVIIASLRMTERAIDRAVEQREAAARFFASEHEAAARTLIATCAQMEVGRLHAQGGRALADKGLGIVRELGLIR